MIFESIEFFQYRCFMRGSLKLYDTDRNGRSINLIIAENGGGKTELLFAFSWVLYDFNFLTLQNKEDTPYSLNSEVYRKLEKSIENCIDHCWVQVVFSHQGKVYTVKKTEHFEKIIGHSSLKRKIETELFIRQENGVTEPPIRNQKYIEKILNEVIPLKVLNGIIFDGERMQKLSSSDERSVESVKGVIFDITNQEKLEYFLEIISSVEKNINKRLSSVSKKTRGRKLDTISNQIDALESTIKCNEKRFQDATEELKACNSELDLISSELKKHNETQELENKRIDTQNNLSKAEKQMQKEVDTFATELNTYGYTLICDKILNESQEMIDAFDIPRGLNTQAVESILKNDKCICGTALSPERIDVLKQLLDFLPPGNLNSALLEQIHGIRSIHKKTTESLKKYRANIKSLDSDLIGYKEDIARYRSQISLSELTDSKKLEDRRTSLLSKKAELELETRTLPDDIEADKIKEIDLRGQKNSLIEMDEIGEKLAEKWKFVNKAKEATEKLRDELQNIALQKINEMLKDSYKQIAENSEIGRDVHLIHNINVSGIKYRVVNYYITSLSSYDHITNWENLCKKYKVKSVTLSEAQKKELVILENAVSKSTGQSKTIAIAFAKAILDYSCSEKEDEIQGEKYYPFLIDSPFGDLSGDNLLNSAQKLHSFSNQVVLMISPDSYNVIKEHVEPYVQSRYKISKIPSKNQSIIGVD